MSSDPAETIRNGPKGRAWSARWGGARETIRRLVGEVERLEQIPAHSLLSRGRGRAHVAEARFAVMLVAHSRGHSSTSIAKALGRDDHTTVLHGISKAEDMRRSDPGFAALVGCLEKAA